MLPDSDVFFARFAAAVDQFGEASWWSRLRGAAAAEVDVKKLGIFPIVHGARTLALQHRVRALGTADRLRALVAGGHLDPALAGELVEALHLFIGLKLASNLRQMAEGRAPDNLVRLSERGTPSGRRCNRRSPSCAGSGSGSAAATGWTCCERPRRPDRALRGLELEPGAGACLASGCGRARGKETA